MTRITVAKGDGIGPEIMDATLEIILAAGAQLEIDEIEVGEKVYLAGNTSGIANESWETIRRNKIFLKAPITPTRWRIQKLKCHNTQIFRIIFKRKALYEFTSICKH